ncbi:DUF2585 domain-containing protein [Sphingobium arseniciresistens]|uniref:DUF2585 domain-containing protein n=1 Tax=Sphingobium arseniciresistens TaxID=3030834 RepID=UPI0030CA3AF4
MTGGWKYWALSPIIVAATIFILLAMGRPPICTCGTVELWHGAVDSGNSQHIADWYSFSHIIHGFLFYGATWLVMRGRALPLRLSVAVLIEAAWEVLENSPIIIDRYRTATIALGYTGDSILNSVSDIAMMTLGFLFAARVPVWLTVAVAIAFELMTLWVIRDNLTLNVLMLAWPVEAIKAWQGGV